MTITNPRIEAARAGVEPTLICRVSSGWVLLCTMQFLRGYCVFNADPVVESINDLNESQRSQFLTDMVMVGDAVLEVTGAYRINYFIAGNSDPYLHAHIVPRYLTEPDELRRLPPWSHPEMSIESTQFDYQRDRKLMKELEIAIQKRL